MIKKRSIRGMLSRRMALAAFIAVSFQLAHNARAQSLELLASIPTSGDTLRVANSGNLVGTISAGSPATQFIDVSNPSAPVLVSSFAGPSFYITDIAMSGNVAYVSSRPYQNPDSVGVRAIDLSNPASPTDIGYFEIASVSPPWSNPGVTSLNVEGTTVFASFGGSEVFILDFQNPSAPGLLSQMPIGSGSSVVVVEEQRFLTIFNGRSVRVFSRNNPADPDLQGVYWLPSSLTTDAAAAIANATRVFIGVNESGLANPFTGNGIQRVAFEPKGTFPDVRYLNTVYTDWRVKSLAVSPSDQEVIAALGAGGVRVYNRNLLRELARVDTNGIAQDIAVSGRLIFIADGDGGLAILRYRAA